MTLPAHVQRQIDEAKTLHEQHYGTGEPADAPADPPPAPLVEQPLEPQSAEKPATSAEDENNPTYAQRWRSLQGVYNATKQRLDESAQRIASLEQFVANMQAQPAVQAQHAQATAPVAAVSPADVTEYGQDMVDFVRRTARGEMAQLAQALSVLNQRVTQLQGLAPAVQQVAHNQQRSAEEVFFERLSAQVPDWARINDDPRFHEWLLTPDSMTGITRQTYLADAQSGFDLPRVVSIFTAFRANAGAPPATSASSPPQQTPKDRLAKQVAPGRASAMTPPPASKTAKQYSRAEISKFYQDRLRGAYKGREADAEAFERDIFLAQSEGRIA